MSSSAPSNALAVGPEGDEGGPSEVPAPSFSQLAGGGGRSAEPGPAGVRGGGAAAAGPAEKPKVLVVGGSMAGSCAALALHAAGCMVEVFERSQELRSQVGGQQSVGGGLLRGKLGVRLWVQRHHEEGPPCLPCRVPAW